MDTHRLYIVGATTNPVTLSLELSIVASLTLSDSFRISDETVAIKVIDMKNIRDVIAKEMLQCEIEALKTLSHPNVLKCHEVFKTVNNCYIVTEFCSEGDLASLIKTKKRLAEGDARSLISDIVAGFLEIADKNYLHRDLKLANIFVSNGIAKIADFGFAKRNTNPGERQKYNVGSPLYMSPQALKKNIYTVKNDIWSIGVLIYQLLHGETPWECKTEKELMDKMVRIPVKFSNSVKVSDELKEFIKRCLEVDEIKRIGVTEIQSYPLINKLMRDRRIEKCRNEPKLSLKIYENKLHKADTVKPLTNISNKENVSVCLPKSLIDKNNIVIIHHINTFRLLYKILEQIKLNRPEESQLIQVLVNEILTRVTQMNKICVLKELTVLPEINESEKYFDEIMNPGFKKYRTVVGEYYRKYNEELKRQVTAGALNSKIREFLKGLKNIQNRQTLFVHWMVEFLSMPKEIKKNHIELILEPEHLPTEEALRNRMKLIL